MSNNIETTDVEIDDVDDYSDNEFSFILDEDGDLKYFMMPENLMEDVPKKVKIILKMFGITDINKLGNHTLH
jgi:hypothetical protein